MKNKEQIIEIERHIENPKWEKRGGKKYEVQTFLVTLEIRDIMNRIRDMAWVIPNLQRENDAWDKKKKSYLIDSILKGYPIPGIMIVANPKYENNTKYKKYLLDGQQRITTLNEYINDKFKLNLLEKDLEYNGKKFGELNAQNQDRINSTVIPIQNITSASPKNDISFMYEIFARINSGGVKLTRQEVRNAINASDGMEKIKSYAKELFSSHFVTIFPNKRNYNEIILWMFRIAYFVWRGSLTNNNIENFSHLENRNLTLDYILDSYTTHYFQENDGNSEDLIKTTKDFLNEINNNNLKKWIMSFDLEFNRTKKAQPTFVDSLAIFYGINKRLDNFSDQKDIFKNAWGINENNSWHNKYKLYFQELTLYKKSIINRYKILFKKN